MRQDVRDTSRLADMREQLPAYFGKHSVSAISSSQLGLRQSYGELSARYGDGTARTGTRQPTLHLMNIGPLRNNPYQPDRTEPVSRRLGDKSQGSSSSNTPPEIYRHPRGVHGYLPKPGTAYAVSGYDFTDQDFVDKQQPIRRRYIAGMQEIDAEISAMRERGHASEAIAHRVVEMRNQLKIDMRELMDPQELDALEDRNREKYGHPLGPTAKDQFDRYQNWETVIERAKATDREINWLLGLSSRHAKREATGPQQ